MHLEEEDLVLGLFEPIVLVLVLVLLEIGALGHGLFP
jgi:hypothetical protein